MKVRAATDADVPAIAALVMAVASAEAPWKSYLPARLRRDPAFVQHAEAVARSYVEASDSASVVMVAELSAAEAGAGRPQVVAVSVWDTTQANCGQQQKAGTFSNNFTRFPSCVRFFCPVLLYNAQCDARFTRNVFRHIVLTE